MSESISIQSRDYWFKVVEMLQQNWALLDSTDEGVSVYFVNDASGVFDVICFDSVDKAHADLRFNGFSRFVEDERARSLLRCPQPPFANRPHPNGPIYSSGRFWKTTQADETN